MAEDIEMKLGELTESNTPVTPVTKRLALGCLTLIAIGALCGDKMQIKDGLLIIIPIITSISAMVDGGK